MKMRLVLSFIAVFVAAPGYAQSGPTEAQQRQACTGDAFRLCFTSLPNRAKIQSCLMAHHDELSAQCRLVFDESLRALGEQPPR